MVTPPRGELSDTALKLSQVIEREAKRSSALRSSRMSRMRSSFASSFNRSSRKWSESSRPNSSKRSSTVAPVPEYASPSTKESEARHTAPGYLIRKGSKLAELQRQGSKVRTTTTERSPSPNDPRQQEPVIVVTLPATAIQRLWMLMDDPQSSQAAHYLSVCIFCFVTVSTIVFIAQTEDGLAIYAAELDLVEMVCAVVFSIELLVRVIACPSKRAFLKDYANWIDISAIFPFYLERILAVDNAGTFGAIRIVRLTRVARVLKMSRYSSAIQVFVQAIAISMKALSMLIFLMAIAMIVFSSMIYFAEFTHDGCRAGGWVGNCSSALSSGGSVTFASSIAGAAAARAASSTDCICVDPNPYKSIASSFWWCIVTMSTVGYGDMTPVTLMGKIVGCASVLTGMLVLALPITVIGTNFQKVMKSVMQQTMKSNVDYLKGKRMICRNEIEAILERFHAVTEDIHLDVDDVISVYDEDNNGMLEDEELAKFRIDLEILQNRFMMNQSSGNGGGDGSGGSSTEVSSLQATRPCEGDTASTWALGSSLHQQQTRFYHHSPALMHSNTSGGLIRRASGPLGTAKSFGDVSPRRSSAMAVVGPLSSLGPGMVMIPREIRSSSVGTTSTSQHAGSEGSSALKTAPEHAGDQQPASLPGGPSRNEMVFDRLRHYSGPLSQEAPHHSGPLSQEVRHHSSALPQEAPHHSGALPQEARHHSDPLSQETLPSPTTSPPPTTTTAANSNPAIDSELFWMRMMDMQRSWEERLLETEQRLEAKLQNLTKMLVRIEGMVELDD